MDLGMIQKSAQAIYPVLTARWTARRKLPSSRARSGLRHSKENVERDGDGVPVEG